MSGFYIMQRFLCSDSAKSREYVQCDRRGFVLSLLQCCGRRDTPRFIGCSRFTRKSTKPRQRSGAIPRFSLPTFFSRDKKVGCNLGRVVLYYISSIWQIEGGKPLFICLTGNNFRYWHVEFGRHRCLNWYNIRVSVPGFRRLRMIPENGCQSGKKLL